MTFHGSDVVIHGVAQHLGFALIAAGALTACGGQNGAQARVPDGAARGRAVYDQLVTQIYGTANQRAAADELAFLIAQQAIATCAAKVGVTYAIPTYIAADRQVVAPGDLLAFAPLRSDFGVGAGIQRRAAAGDLVNPGLAAASSDGERDRWWTATNSCQTAEAHGNSLTSPPGQAQLEERLIATLQAVQNRVLPDLTAEYATCMHSAGIDARDLAETYLEVGRAYPAVSYGEPFDVTTLPGWADAVAYEHKAAAADAGCRAGYLDVAMAAARPDLADFAAANASTLSGHAAAWSDVERQLAGVRAQLETTD